MNIFMRGIGIYACKDPANILHACVCVIECFVRCRGCFIGSKCQVWASMFDGTNFVSAEISHLVLRRILVGEDKFTLQFLPAIKAIGHRSPILFLAYGSPSYLWHRPRSKRKIDIRLTGPSINCQRRNFKRISNEEKVQNYRPQISSRFQTKNHPKPSRFQSNCNAIHYLFRAADI